MNLRTQRDLHANVVLDSVDAERATEARADEPQDS